MRVSFEQLAPNARVWIYQNNKAIDEDSLALIQDEISAFIDQWSAHQQPLAAYGDVLHHRFIVILVDERFNAATGCSIDASVAFVKDLERRYGLQLFDRFTFSYVIDDTVFTVPKDQFSRLYREGLISAETIVFDNLVKTKEELENKWRKPLGDSWLKRFV